MQRIIKMLMPCGPASQSWKQTCLNLGSSRSRPQDKWFIWGWTQERPASRVGKWNGEGNIRWIIKAITSAGNQSPVWLGDSRDGVNMSELLRGSWGIGPPTLVNQGWEFLPRAANFQVPPSCPSRAKGGKEPQVLTLRSLTWYVWSVKVGYWQYLLQPSGAN